MRRCRFACVGALLLALLLTGCGKAGTAPEDGGADFSETEQVETPEARRIVPAAAERVAAGIRRGERIFFTRDTHGADYLHTREGRNLPVPHCIRGTEGWEIVEQLRPASAGQAILDKPSFGSAELGRLLAEENEKELIEKVTLIGLCTDICVISNALLVKAFLPEAEVAVDAACCAGVTPESHRTALAAMKSCQITVEHEALPL